MKNAPPAAARPPGTIGHTATPSRPVYVSLRFRLLGPLLLLLIADAAVTGWAAWAAAGRAEGRIDGQLRSVVRQLTEPPTYPLTLPVMHKMKELSGAEFVLTRRNGEAESTFDPPVSGFQPAVEVTVHGQPHRVTWLTLPDGHPNAGDVLSVCYPESLRQTAVWSAVRPPLVLGGAVAVTAALIAALGSRVANRVRQVRRHTRAIADGVYEPAAVPDANDELRDLTVSVNELCAKLSAYELELKHTERLRVLGQFSGGLAHQLRNAATGAKLAVQLYRSEHTTADGEPLDVALRQLARIESTLQQFLSLGRPATPVFEPYDLIELISSVIELHRPQSRHAGITLGWHPNGSWMSHGDRMLLGHLFGNLLGNALDAAGPGGRVEVACHLESERAVVDVIDSGPGPLADISDKLFAPFVTGKEQGVGLGLAVAKQAADAHGAQVEWFRRGESTVFRVVIPRSERGGSEPAPVAVTSVAP